MKFLATGCLACLVLGVCVIGAVVLWLLHEKPLLDADISLPTKAVLDEPIAMLVTASNSHSASVTLDSIDIDDAFLAGFQVVSVVPKEEETSHVPLVNQRSWQFSQPVAPGATIGVAYTLKPVMEGHFSGDVDVCNPNQDFVTLVADVVVRKK